MSELAAVDAYLEEQRSAFEAELTELLKIPSVSADSAYAEHVTAAAGWMGKKFEGLGFTTEVVPTDGHPVVFAQSPEVPGAPTVLVYGHYDVQPPDPLELWHSPPFEPVIKDGNIYARGATDDKGQMLTHVLSAQAWVKAGGGVPINLKYIIEGEEEVGSEHLGPFIKANRDRLKTDVIVISDTSQYAPGFPAITYGLKGIAYFEIHLTGPAMDLHSGLFGGAVTNPINTISKLLGSLIDGEGRIQVPGFYDAVVPMSEEERADFAALPFEESEFLKKIGTTGSTGEAGYTTLERRWARPTCDVNGIWGGYQGQGSKTVLPSKAGAKFSFRLVADQDPHEIEKQVEAYLRSQLPPGIEMKFKAYHGSGGFLADRNSPYMKAAKAAITAGFGKEPVLIRSGGSIPIITTFTEELGVDTLLLGWGRDDDNLHSPNEKFNLGDFHRGIKSSAHLWAEIGKQA